MRARDTIPTCTTRSYTAVVHAPWRTRVRVTERDYMHITVVGVLLAVSTFLLVYCIRVIDPLRALLLDYCDVIVAAAVVGGSTAARGPGSGSNSGSAGRSGGGGSTPLLSGRRPLWLALAGMLLILWYNPAYHATLAAERHSASILARVGGRPRSPVLRAGDDFVSSAGGRHLLQAAAPAAGAAAGAAAAAPKLPGAAAAAIRRAAQIAAAAANAQRTPLGAHAAATAGATAADGVGERAAPGPVDTDDAASEGGAAAANAGAATRAPRWGGDGTPEPQLQPAAPAVAGHAQPQPPPAAAADEEDPAVDGARAWGDSGSDQGAAGGDSDAEDGEAAAKAGAADWQRRAAADAAAEAARAAPHLAPRGGEAGDADGSEAAADREDAAAVGEAGKADSPHSLFGAAAAPSGLQASGNSRRAAALAAARRVVAAEAAAVERVLERHDQRAVFLAGALMVVASTLNALRRRLGRGVATSTGLGTRRTHALVLVAAAAVWLPVAAMAAAWGVGTDSARGSGGSGGDDGDSEWSPVSAGDSQPSLIGFLCAAAAFGALVLLLAEYAAELPLTAAGSDGGVDAAGGKLSVSTLAGSGVQPGAALAASDAAALRAFTTFVAFLAALAADALLGGDGSYEVTGPLLLGAAAFLPGTIALSGADVRPLLRLATGHEDVLGASMRVLRALWDSLLAPVLGVAATPTGSDGAGEDWLQGGGGGLFSPSSFRAVSAAIESVAGPSVASAFDRFAATTATVMRHVWEDANSRKIFMFLCINVSGGQL